MTKKEIIEETYKLFRDLDVNNVLNVKDLFYDNNEHLNFTILHKNKLLIFINIDSNKDKNNINLKIISYNLEFYTTIENELIYTAEELIRNTLKGINKLITYWNIEK